MPVDQISVPVKGSIGTLSQTISIPCTGEIKATSFSLPVKGSYSPTPPDPPSNPLGVHLGQAVIQLAWQYDPTQLPRVDYFEVYAGLSASGPFFPYPTGRFRGLAGRLLNFPLGTTAYLRIRAVGKGGLKSDFVPVKRGIYQPIEGALMVTTISGSTLAAGTVFSALHPTSHLPINFRVKDTFVFP